MEFSSWQDERFVPQNIQTSSRFHPAFVLGGVGCLHKATHPPPSSLKVK